MFSASRDDTDARFRGLYAEHGPALPRLSTAPGAPAPPQTELNEDLALARGQWADTSIDDLSLRAESSRASLFPIRFVGPHIGSCTKLHRRVMHPTPD